MLWLLLLDRIVRIFLTQLGSRSRLATLLYKLFGENIAFGGYTRILYGIGVKIPLTSGRHCCLMSLIHILLIIVLLAHVTVLIAGRLQHQGISIADQVCASVNGLCHQPFLLGLSAGSIITAYFF